MWSLKIFDSFNSNVSYYFADDVLPYALSYNEMYTLLCVGRLVRERYIDGCYCPLEFSVVNK